MQNIALAQLFLGIIAVANTISLLVFATALRKATYNLNIVSDLNFKQVMRLELTITKVDETLIRMEKATIIVAANLADSIARADATNGPAGAAADAALRASVCDGNV